MTQTIFIYFILAHINTDKDKQMDSSVEATYSYLKNKYNTSVIGKKELAEELNIAPSTLDLYLSKGMGIPRYKKLGTAKNARVVFNLYDIAVFLHTDQIETM